MEKEDVRPVPIAVKHARCNSPVMEPEPGGAGAGVGVVWCGSTRQQAWNGGGHPVKERALKPLNERSDHRGKQCFQVGADAFKRK